MAEFVRIWDESIDNGDGTFGNYVEHDTTIIEKEIVGVPVVPVSISTNINTGVINKVIDTNDITASTNVVNIAQIFRPVTVEKSYANRLTIETGLSKQISIEASRNEIVINTSSKGQRGEIGARGEDSVIEFNPNLYYAHGKLALFDRKIWIAREVLDGTETPLASPEENSLWSEILDLRAVTELPLTSGYEVSTAAEFTALEPTLELGDLVKVSDVLPSGEATLPVELFNATVAYEIVELGGPLITEETGVQFFVTGSAGTSLVIQGARFDEETKSLLDYDVLVGDLETAFNEVGIIFGREADSGENSLIHIGSNFGEESPATFQVLSISQESTTLGNHSIRMIVASETGSESVTIFASPIVPNLDTRLFGVIPPGIAIDGLVDDLVIGDRIHIQGDRENTLQPIVRVTQTLNRTFYDLLVYEGFDVGEFIIGEVIDAQLLTAGQWYSRNNNIASNLRKLDSLATDQLLRNEVDELLDKVNVSPGILSQANKTAIENFLGSNPQPYTVDDDRRNILATKRILGSSTNSTTNLISGQGLSFAASSRYIGIQDGAQQNYIDDVDEPEIDGVPTNLYTTSSNETINTITREVRTLHSNAEKNVIQSVEADGVLSINSDRELSSDAQVNAINSVVSSSNGKDFSFDTGSKQLLIPEISISDTGGSAASGNLIQLDPNGLIPSTAIGKLNLSNVTAFKIIENRNSQAIDTLPWSTGDLAIVSGVPDLTTTETLVSGSNLLVVSDTSDLYVPGTDETSTVFLSTSGGNFKEVKYSNNDTVTNTLTMVNNFVDDDVTDFPIGTTVGVQTGTFVFFSDDQDPAVATINSDWLEIVPFTGVVSSINGDSGVVTLTAAGINHINANSDSESIQTGINAIRSNITTVETYAGVASDGSNPATGITKNIEDNTADINTLNGGTGTRTEKQDKIESTNASSVRTELNVADGAEVNVQSDWDESTNTEDSFIQNKPTNLSSFTNDAGYITASGDASLSTYFAVKLTNGNDLEIRSFTGEDENGIEVDEIINIEQLITSGYELIEGTTADTVSVDDNGGRTLRRVG